MANWSPFHVQFHGDDRLLSELFQHWREIAAANAPGYELTVLDNPYADAGEPISGAIFHLRFDERRFGFHGVGMWTPPLNWLQSLTASVPMVCALDYQNPDDNVEHFVLIIGNEIHSIYSIENEHKDEVELRVMTQEIIAHLPRPPESREIRSFEEDDAD